MGEEKRERVRHVEQTNKRSLGMGDYLSIFTEHNRANTRKAIIIVSVDEESDLKGMEPLHLEKKLIIPVLSILALSGQPQPLFVSSSSPSSPFL